MPCPCRTPQSGFIHGSSAVLRLLLENSQKSRRFLGTVRALDEHIEARAKKSRLYLNDYFIPVVSFIKRHQAANAGKYPTISLIMQETGGTRYLVRKILLGIKTGHVDVNVEESISSVEKTNEGYAELEEVSLREGVLHYGDAKELKIDMVEFRDIERFDQVDVDQVLKEKDESSALKSIPAEDMLVEHLDLDRIDVGSIVKDMEEKEVSDLILSPASEKASDSLGHIKDMLPTIDTLQESNKFSTPLRPLYQKSVASRRVNLSPEMGLESDLSWKETLNSIFPELQAGPEKNHTPNQADMTKETLLARQYGIILTPKERKSNFGSISKVELKEAFQNCGDILKTRISKEKGKWQALIYFKTENGLKEALKMNPALVKGEEVRVEKISPSTGEETVEHVHPVTDENMKSVVSQIVNKLSNIPQGRPSLKASYASGKKVSTISSSKWSNDTLSSVLAALTPTSFVKSSPMSKTLNKVQNIVSIKKCATHLCLDSLKDYFSRYGEVTCCHAAGSKGSDRTCYIEFQNTWDKQKALEIQKFIIDGHIFEIRNDEVPETSIVVRLESISSETSMDKVMTVCGGYGAVTDVKAISTDTCDVQFGQLEKIQIGEILNRLNEVTVDQRRWQATLLCHGYQRVSDLKSTCEVCLQRQEDNVKLLRLVKQLLVHVEEMCARG